MPKVNLIQEEAFTFALQTMALAKRLRMEKEYEPASQLWRAGMSIGANVEKTQAAQSKADFHAKTAIASKEAGEALYWLRLAEKGEVLAVGDLASAKTQCERIVQILTSIVKIVRMAMPASKIKHSASKNL